MSEFWGRLGGWLVRERAVGNKAGLLARATRCGLPVPPGYVVFHEAVLELERQGAIAWEGDVVVVRDARRIMRVLDPPKYDKRLAVRSAFSAEDALHQSFAGYFQSVLDVDGRDEQAFAQALADVWSSSTRYRAEFRLDVIVMEMVPAEFAGVAFTEYEYEDDLINYTHGTAEGLVGGAEAGTVEDLPKLRRWERPDPEMSGAFRRRLQALLRDLRHRFGGEDWDVEWADDGTTCYLVQARPITSPTRRNEAFAIANHKEILPELPSRFMSTLIASCSAGLFDYYRRFDPWLPTTRPFIELFAGRPMINLSLLTEMMRAWGLPTTWVTDAIGGQVGKPAELDRGRVLRRSLVLARQAVSHQVAPWHAARTAAELEKRCARPGDTFAACVRTMQWAYTRLVTEVFGLTAAMSAPMAALRKRGVLAQLAQNERSPASSLADELEALRSFVAGDAEALAALIRGVEPARADFRHKWEEFLERHGHRAPYESDLARTRYAEDAGSLLRSLALPAPSRIFRSEEESKTGLVIRLLWLQARRPMAARERLRDRAMAAFFSVRKKMLELATQAVERGALPSAERVWDLSVEEIGLLDQGWVPPEAFWARRDAEIAKLSRLQLPDLVHRFDDLENLAPAFPATDRWGGSGLTGGMIEGTAWLPEEPDEPLPAGFAPATTILVARAVDAGWVPVFGIVAGVVVESGGDLSHGSIILRELGIPAATNVHGVTHGIGTGDRIRLDARSGTVERVRQPVSHTKQS